MRPKLCFDAQPRFWDGWAAAAFEAPAPPAASPSLETLSTPPQRNATESDTALLARGRVMLEQMEQEGSWLRAVGQLRAALRAAERAGGAARFVPGSRALLHSGASAGAASSGSQASV